MLPESSMPEWWNWELTFSAHAELRMDSRGVTEVDVRAMLQHAARYQASTVEGRYMIGVIHRQQQWSVIVEPDPDAELLVVVTAFEVSQ